MQNKTKEINVELVNKWKKEIKDILIEEIKEREDNGSLR